jgi:hypothetical protein
VTTSVTFDREISRILIRRCLSCHSEGSLAFPLTSYEETRPWARAILEEVLSRSMPPWRAVAGYGSFVNDGGLTTRELQTIVAWVEGNGPKSPEERVILRPDRIRTPEDQRLALDLDRWHLGQPSIVRSVDPAAWSPPSPDGVVRTLVDLDLDVDHRISGVEFRPSDRRDLRAAQFRLETTGQWLGSWTPWHTATSLPDGVAYLVPAGARIVAELHYESRSDQVGESGKIALYDAAGGPAHCASEFALAAEGDVSPHAANERFAASVTLPTDTTVLALIPELEEGARSLEVRARKPNGVVEVLLLVRDILHDWPTPYILDSGLPLPKGTELSVIAYYERLSDGQRGGGVRMSVSAHTGTGCAQPVEAQAVAGSLPPDDRYRPEEAT